MKKILIVITIMLIILLFYQSVFAVEQKNVLETNTTSELIKVQNETRTEIDEYTRKYGSPEYGNAAYIINKVRIYSIPLCFVGIAIGALYQYVIGTRRLDMKHRGFGIIIVSLTILIICQVLPLVFAVVVRGFGGVGA